MARDLWWAFAAVAVACLWLAVAALLADRRLEPATRYLRRSRLCRTVGGAAALVPRRLGDYLPARVVTGMRLAALATVALVPLLAWGPLAAPVPVRGLVVGGRGGAMATATLAVAMAAAVELAVRRLVGRPQPAADPEALAVDDALRSTSVHAVAGAGLAIVLLSLSLQVGLVAANLAGGPGRTAVVALSWACAAAALAAWVRVGHSRRWTVRRVLARDAGGPGRA
jgi:hypothetical protein